MRERQRTDLLLRGKPGLITKSEYLTRSDVPLVSGLTSYQIGSVGDALTVEPAYKFDIIVEMLRTFKNNGHMNSF